MSAVIDHMRKVPLFRGMTTSGLETVADRASETTFADGETVTREGEPGETFYIVTAGRLRVSKNGAFVRELGPGDFLGEIALVDGGPRTATVTADGPVEALVIRRADFLEMVEWDSAVRLGVFDGIDRTHPKDRSGRHPRLKRARCARRPRPRHRADDESKRPPALPGAAAVQDQIGSISETVAAGLRGLPPRRCHRDQERPPAVDRLRLGCRVAIGWWRRYHGRRGRRRA